MDEKTILEKDGFCSMGKWLSTGVLEAVLSPLSLGPPTLDAPLSLEPPTLDSTLVLVQSALLLWNPH